MAIVWIPSTIQELTNDQAKLEVDGKTVSEVIRNIDLAYPGTWDALINDNALRAGIIIAVDGTVDSRQLLQPVHPDSEIHFVPAIFSG